MDLEIELSVIKEKIQSLFSNFKNSSMKKLNTVIGSEMILIY